MSADTSSRVYPVSVFMQQAKQLLEGHFTWVAITGEISNWMMAQSGHAYFTLKDQVAQIRCAFFKPGVQRVNFTPKNGQQVIIQARVSLYEARGDFQLIVLSMLPAGDGALQLAFLQLKQKLSAEGLFDPARKRPMPPFVRTIGVITSPRGAALHDILTVSQRRSPITSLIIYPTLVQGATAAHQIAETIALANQRHEVDVLLIARGGGSLEDLWAFNEECVARALAASQLPTVSAIGHEVDFTIADFVADLRAPTPSAAAELLTPDFSIWQQRFLQLCRSLPQTMQRQLSQTEHQLRALQRQLRHPRERLQAFARQTHELTKRLERSTHIQLTQHQQHLTKLAATLHAVSPLQTLERGYSIVTEASSNTIIRDANQAPPNTKVQLRFAHGARLAEIIE